MTSETNKKLSRFTFIVGFLGVLTFSVFQFQNCAPPSGDPNLPCRGRNCPKATTTGGRTSGSNSGSQVPGPGSGGNGGNVTTGAEPAPTQPPGSGSGVNPPGPTQPPSEFPATAQCEFYFDFLDKPSGWVAVRNLALISPQSNIASIPPMQGSDLQTYAAAGFPYDAVTSTGSNFVKNCVGKAYETYQSLEAQHCPKSGIKRIRTRTTVRIQFQPGTRSEMVMTTMNGGQASEPFPASSDDAFDCKGVNVISGKAGNGDYDYGTASRLDTSRLPANHNGTLYLNSFAVALHDFNIYRTSDVLKLIVDTVNSPSFSKLNSAKGTSHIEVAKIKFKGQYQSTLTASNRYNCTMKIRIPTLYTAEATEGTDHVIRVNDIASLPSGGGSTYGDFEVQPLGGAGISTRGWVTIETVDCAQATIKDLEVWIR